MLVRDEIDRLFDLAVNDVLGTEVEPSLAMTFTRSIAGCFLFFTLTQCFERPA